MKKILCIILSLTLAASLAACAGSGSQSETTTTAGEEDTTKSETPTGTDTGFEAYLDENTEATLNVAGSWGNFEALEQVAIDFQEYYPNVEVVYSQLDDYGTNIVNRMTTGEDLDLFMFSGWNFNEENAGVLFEHSEALDDIGIDLTSINDEYVGLFAEDGSTYALPLYLSGCGMMVNLDILEENGLEVPTTEAELLECCEKLEEAGYEGPLWIEEKYLARCYAPDCVDQVKSGQSLDDAFEEASERMDNLVASGYLNSECGTLEDTYNALILRFFEGDIPFVFINADNYSGTKKREAKSETFTAAPFEYAYVAAPIGDETAKYAYNGAASYYMGIYNGSENIELAKEFLRFMYTDAEQEVLENIKNMPVANKNVGLADFPYIAGAENEVQLENGLEDLTIVIDCTNKVAEYEMPETK